MVTGRNHVHYVVTEFGVADLYGKSVRQRVKALVNIAHPDFRADLEKQARKLNWSIDMDRKVKIVATIGPASQENAVVGNLLQAGMDVARLNF